MLRGEATNTNFIVFGLTRSGLEPTIYRTGGEDANHYTTDAVDEMKGRYESVNQRTYKYCKPVNRHDAVESITFILI